MFIHIPCMCMSLKKMVENFNGEVQSAPQRSNVGHSRKQVVTGECAVTMWQHAPSLMVRQSAAPGPARSAVARKSCPKPTRPMTSNDSHCNAPSMSIAFSAPCSLSRSTSRVATSSTVPNPFLRTCRLWITVMLADIPEAHSEDRLRWITATVFCINMVALRATLPKRNTAFFRCLTFLITAIHWRERTCMVNQSCRRSASL